MMPGTPGRYRHHPRGDPHMTATNSATRKAKGRKFQQTIRQDLLDATGLQPDDIESRPTSSPGTDILLSPAAQVRIPYAIEAKHQEAWQIPSWWRQCTANAEATGLRPLLVVKRNRSEPLAVLRWSDLLNLLSVEED